MADTVLHIVGHVGTDVDYRQVGSGTDLSTFRLAATPRRFDKVQRQYVDGTTTWFSVQCWRSLAQHVRDSVRRGDPVLVIGRLKTDEWEKDGQQYSRLVIEASHVGHDLARGVTRFSKTPPRVTQAESDDSHDAHAALEQVESGTTRAGDGDGGTEHDGVGLREAS